VRIEVRGRAGLLSDPLRAHAERRLRFAVGRFASRVEKLTVRVDDVNGPRGGVDKECVIVASLVPSGGVKVEERDLDLYQAVDRATDRLGRSVAREVQRRRELRFALRRTREGLV
jgi:ribosome-associated translation inhibitor RaiA